MWMSRGPRTCCMLKRKHGGTAMASVGLETFIDETIRLSREKGYHPTAFSAMRERYTTVPAISRLVVSGDIQSGFNRLRQLGLLDWTIEAAVMKFPDEFSREVREAAEWRLRQARGDQGRAAGDQPGPADSIRTYIRAKDESRPWLMRHAFAEDSRLEFDIRTDTITFPPSAQGREAITDVLIRRFSSDYENVYTYCLSLPPEGASCQFSCGWLVGMSQRADGKVRVGTGRYDWDFAPGERCLVARLRITIERMPVLPATCLEPVMTRLSALPYPWCPPGEAARVMPQIDGLEEVRARLEGLR